MKSVNQLQRCITGMALLILYLPIVVIVCYSFNAAPRGMVWQGFSWRWYAEVWQNKSLMDSVQNSLQVCAATTALSVVIGVGIAFLLSEAAGRTFRLLAPLILLPILTPDLLIALTNALTYQAIKVPKGILTIAASQSVVGAAYVAIMVTVRLRSINYHAYVRAASSLGASQWRIAIDHFLPLSTTPVLLGGGVVCVFSLQDFLYAFFCGGVGSTTLAVHVYGLVRFGPHGGLNVIYVLLFVIASAGLWSVSKASRRD